jgi:ribosomal protein S27AE
MINKLNRQCNFCGAAAQGRLMAPYDNGREIVTEARYTCPRCMNVFAKEIVKREPKQVDKK